MSVELFDRSKHKNIIKLHSKLVGDDHLDTMLVLVFMLNEEAVGYSIIGRNDTDSKTTAKIDWIYAPGHGKEFLKIIHKKLKKSGFTKVVLNVSIDPTELKDTVMKRLNFYIGFDYRVRDIKFREKHGPLLSMERAL